MVRHFRISVICYLVILFSGCGGGGDSTMSSPPPVSQNLRGQSFNTMAATYDAFSTLSDYSSIKDLSPNTTVTVSPTGDSQTLPAAASNNLSYVSFGEWNAPSGGTTSGGFFAYGVVTPGPAIPTTGQATYLGSFHGKFFSLGLISFVNTVDGTLTASADFAQRTVAIATANTNFPDLNLTGGLLYAAGINALSGTLFTTGSDSIGSLARGTAYARFFGPNAEEIGGAFRLQRTIVVPLFGTLNNTYVGSFGAKR